jgi:hypothetical protein
VVWPLSRLTQNPAGLRRQWMHSWMVRGSSLDTVIVRRREAVAAGAGPVLAGRNARGRCQILGEPPGEAVAAWLTGQLGFLALGLACVGLAGAR